MPCIVASPVNSHCPRGGHSSSLDCRGLEGVSQFCQCGSRFGDGPVKAHFDLIISPVVGLEYLVLGKGCGWGESGSRSWRDI